MRLALQQGIQNPTAGLCTARVIAANHIVGRPDPLEELLVHVLGTAVVGHIGQVHIDGWPRGYGGTGLWGCVP